VASMGDRFVLLRMDSSICRMPAGRRAIGNISSEEVTRADLAKAVGGVLAGMRESVSPPDEEEIEILLAAADLVTLARTGGDLRLSRRRDRCARSRDADPVC
jgi:hypothetical protein